MLSHEDGRAILAELSIALFDAEELFEVVDVDHSGEIDLAEFLDAFHRVTGEAEAKHLLLLHYAVRPDRGMSLRAALTAAAFR